MQTKTKSNEWHDGSDGKEEDSGLKGPIFNPWPRQGKLKNIFSCFWLVVLEPMRSSSKVFAVLLQIHLIINIHVNGEEDILFP